MKMLLSLNSKTISRKYNKSCASKCQIEILSFMKVTSIFLYEILWNRRYDDITVYKLGKIRFKSKVIVGCWIIEYFSVTFKNKNYHTIIYII